MSDKKPGEPPKLLIPRGLVRLCLCSTLVTALAQREVERNSAFCSFFLFFWGGRGTAHFFPRLPDRWQREHRCCRRLVPLRRQHQGLKGYMIYICIYIWYSVASPPPPPPPMVMGQTSTPPPPCGCGPVVGLWWFRVGLELV